MDIEVLEQRNLLEYESALSFSHVWRVCKQITASLVGFVFIASKSWVKKKKALTSSIRTPCLVLFGLLFSKHTRCYNLHLFGWCLKCSVILRLMEGKMPLAPLMNFMNFSHLLTLPSWLLPWNRNPSMTRSRSQWKQPFLQQNSVQSVHNSEGFCLYNWNPSS